MDFSNWKTLLEIDNNLKLSFFKKLNFEKKSEVFCELKIESQNFIFENLNKKDFSSIFKNMESDTRADFYKQLTIEQQNKLIPDFPGDESGWYLLDIGSVVKFNING